MVKNEQVRIELVINLCISDRDEPEVAALGGIGDFSILATRPPAEGVLQWAREVARYAGDKCSQHNNRFLRFPRERALVGVAFVLMPLVTKPSVEPSALDDKHHIPSTRALAPETQDALVSALADLGGLAVQPGAVEDDPGVLGLLITAQV